MNNISAIREAVPLAPGVPPLALGASEVDRRLPDGLARAALHDLYGDDDDAAAALGFGLLLAFRAAGGKPIVVVRDDRCVAGFGRLSGDGLADLGCDANALIVVHAADMLATLRTAADAASCPALGSVVVQPWRTSPAFDLTASRRIALRSARAGVFTVVVRVATPPEPSAAATRWRVRAAASTPLAAAAPGHPAFHLSLLHHRRGIAGFDARVEWNRDLRSFGDAPLSRLVPAVAAGRARGPGERRAA